MPLEFRSKRPAKCELFAQQIGHVAKIASIPDSGIELLDEFGNAHKSRQAAGATTTAVPYARTSVTPCMISVASYRTPITDLLRLRSMLEHPLERIIPGVLTQLCEETDVAADKGLERCANGSDNGSRADYDSTHQAKIGNNPIAAQIKRRCHHIVWHPSTFVVRHLCSP